MRGVTTAFKNAMKAPVKEVLGVLTFPYDSDDDITSDGDLQKYTIESGSLTFGKTALRKLTGSYLGTKNIAGKKIAVKMAVRLPDGSYSYMDVGEFMISSCEMVKDSGITTFIGYDNMIYSVQEYKPSLFTYPTTVGALYTQIADAIGVDVETADIPFKDLAITDDLYANISGTQYRNILEDIAVLGGSICIINEFNQLAMRSVKTPTNTVETLTYAELKKLKNEDLYGVVNSLVLSRQPQEDNVVLQDATSVTANGLTEIKIVNNEIIDKRREDVATSILPYFDGTSFYPFSADTIGLGWYELGDKILITDDEAVTREVRVLGIKLMVDGSVKETLSAIAPTLTQTNYARAGGITSRVKNTEIMVDKQQQQITSVVSDVTTLDGLTTENFTRIDQDLTSIIQSVQTTGGINLLKNSAFYQIDTSGFPSFWITSGTGTFTTQASTEAMSKGSLSGNIITTRNVVVKQTVTVVQDTSEIPDDKKTRYSFKTLVKKGIVGTATIKVYNDLESYITTIPAGTASDYEEVTFENLLPKMSWYKIELTGSADSDTSYTDTMFSVGQYPSSWAQSNGEILNTNVQINENGIIVKSSVFAGDYTAITPLEFSGYSKIGGSTVKVFTLNKDQTQVKKLQATDEISMAPIKIVPITTGSVTGWAFVKRST